jgi:hypothetical protein
MDREQILFVSDRMLNAACSSDYPCTEYFSMAPGIMVLLGYSPTHRYALRVYVMDCNGSAGYLNFHTVKHLLRCMTPV